MKQKQNTQLQTDSRESTCPLLSKGSGKRRTRQPNLSKEKVELMQSAREVFDEDPRAYLDIVEKRYTDKYGFNLSFYAVPEDGKDYSPLGIETFSEGTEREAEKKRREVFRKELRKKQIQWARQKWKYKRPGTKHNVRMFDETMEEGNAGTILEADRAVSEEVQLGTNRADTLMENVELWAPEGWIAQTEARSNQLDLSGSSGSTNDQGSARIFDQTPENFLQTFADTLTSMTGDVITIVASGPRPDGTFGVKSATALPPALRSSNSGVGDIPSSIGPQDTRELISVYREYAKHAFGNINARPIDQPNVSSPVPPGSATTPVPVLHDQARAESESVTVTSTSQPPAPASSTGVSSISHPSYPSFHIPLPPAILPPVNGSMESSPSSSASEPIAAAPETPESDRSPSSSSRVRRKRVSEVDALNAETAQLIPIIRKRPRLDVTPAKSLKETGLVPAVRKRRIRNSPRRGTEKVHKVCVNGDSEGEVLDKRILEREPEVACEEDEDKILGKQEPVSKTTEEKGRCLLM
ncbi:hypothetical protein L218DRAFT_1081501 [Marasmius fiardii PR-910]|nr:hypothetical protein L218DRAFT_1081501 [Marasmius fiardii PR-910]